MLTRSFSHLPFIGAEKITFPLKRFTDISNYRVASILKMLPKFDDNCRAKSVIPWERIDSQFIDGTVNKHISNNFRILVNLCSCFLKFKKNIIQKCK